MSKNEEEQAAMQWKDEADSYQAGLVNHVLESDERIELLLVEFWKRIINDGIANAMVVPWTTIDFDILERQYEEDENCYLHAAFSDDSNQNCKGVPRYYLKSRYFSCIHNEEEDSETFNRIQITWYLEQYRKLKECLGHAEIEPLLKKLEAIRPFEAYASTAFGWFNLQLGEPEFGPLPPNDQHLLDNQSPIRRDQSTNSMPAPSAPVIDTQSAVKELTDALSLLLPQHFKEANCTVTRGLLYGKHALFYQIESTQFPDESFDTVNERVEKAGTQLLQFVTKDGGSFHGLQIKMEQKPNGTWESSMELLKPVSY